MRILITSILALALAAPAVAGDDQPPRNKVEHALRGTLYAVDLPEAWLIKNAHCTRIAFTMFDCSLRLQSPYDRHSRLTVSAVCAVVTSVDPFVVALPKTAPGPPTCRAP